MGRAPTCKMELIRDAGFLFLTVFVVGLHGFGDFEFLKEAVSSNRPGSVRKILNRGVRPDDGYFHDNSRQSLLMLASWKREREIVLLLLQHGADVNRVNYNGATALLYASAGGDPDIMRTLQKSGANVQVKDKMGQTALHWAVAADQVDTLRYGIEQGLNPKAQDMRHKSPLDLATRMFSRKCVKYLKSCCEITTPDPTPARPSFETLRQALADGNRAAVKHALRAGVPPDDGYWDPQYNITLLMHAAEMANLGMVNLLLKYGADPNKRNPYGLSSMHYASAGGTKAVLRDLIKAGGDLFVATKDGWTVVHCAAAYNKIDNLKYAVNMGVDIEQKDRLGKTALDHSRMMQNNMVTKYLKRLHAERDRLAPPRPINDEAKFKESRGASPEQTQPPTFEDLKKAVDHMDAPKVEKLLQLGIHPDKGFHDDYDRVTLLMEAAARRYQHIVRLLLVYGANPNRQTKMNRRTAMHFAAGAGDVNVMKQLVHRGGDIQALDLHKMSVLHWATVGDNVEALRYGVGKGVNIHTRDADGYTALRMAQRIRSTRCVRYLKYILSHSASVRFRFIPRSNI